MALIVRFSPECYLDFDDYTLYCSNGSAITLKKYPYAILRAMTASHQVFTREQIICLRWGEAEACKYNDRSADTQISAIRRLDPALKPLFESVTGVGYRYTGPLQRQETQEALGEPSGDPKEQEAKEGLRRTLPGSAGNRDVTMTQGPRPQLFREAEKPLAGSIPADPAADNRFVDRETGSDDLRNWSRPMSVEEAERSLCAWLDRAVRCRDLRRVPWLVHELISLLDMRCMFLEMGELQRLYMTLERGRDAFSLSVTDAARALELQVERQLLRLYRRIREKQIEKAREGLAAARRMGRQDYADDYILKIREYEEDLQRVKDCAVDDADWPMGQH